MRFPSSEIPNRQISHKTSIIIGQNTLHSTCIVSTTTTDNQYGRGKVWGGGKSLFRSTISLAIQDAVQRSQAGDPRLSSGGQQIPIRAFNLLFSCVNFQFLVQPPFDIYTCSVYSGQRGFFELYIPILSNRTVSTKYIGGTWSTTNAPHGAEAEEPKCNLFIQFEHDILCRPTLTKCLYK